VRAFTVFSISFAMAFGQAPGKIITFNRADNCKVISAGGKYQVLG
jgi:hypothetical protein